MNFAPFQRPVGSPNQRRPSQDSLNPVSERGPMAELGNNTPMRSRTPSRQPSIPPPSQSRFSVVVTASPNKEKYHTPKVTYDEERDDLPQGKRGVISDLSPQFSKIKKVKAAKEAEKAAAMARAGRQASTAAKQLINNQYDKKKAFARHTVASPGWPSALSAPKPSASGTSTPDGSKKVGRPKGWKPGMSYAQMRGDPIPAPKPKSGAFGVVKRRGRPPKAPSPEPLDIYRALKPVYLSFLCEWKDCKADLHNLETLRRHVNLVHLEEQDYEDEETAQLPWTCLWGKCGLAAQAPTFENYEDMEEHVEKKHMVPFSWHIGDGPKLTIPEWKPEKKEGEANDDDDDIPAYLKDKDGNQVTPSIKEQKMEDAAQLKEKRRRLWRMLQARNDNLPSEDEAEHPEPDDEEAMVV